MNGMWWLMAAHEELRSTPVPPEPDAVVEPPPIVIPDKSVRLSCPKCGKTGRGIVIHIRNCKG